MDKPSPNRQPLGDPLEIFKRAFAAEFYGNHLIETEIEEYVTFQRGTGGDVVWAEHDQSAESRYVVHRVEDQGRQRFASSHVARVVFKKEVVFDQSWPRQSIENELSKGGKAFAGEVNHAFVDVLAESGRESFEIQDEELDVFLAGVVDRLRADGFEPNRFLFPSQIKTRLEQRGAILDDGLIENLHYAGKTIVGDLAAFWSRQLPKDTALVFASGVGVVTKREPAFWMGVSGWRAKVRGEVQINPIIKNTRGVVSIKGVEQAVSRGAEPELVVSTETLDRFLGEIEDLIKTSKIEKSIADIALYDLGQARKAYKSGAFKACVVMLGAVLEGLMLGTLRRDDVLEAIKQGKIRLPPRVCQALGGTSQSIDDLRCRAARKRQGKTGLGFEEYRQAIRGFLPDVEHTKIEGIQNFRNAIHPSMAIKHPDKYSEISEDMAMGFVTSLKGIAESILRWIP